MAAQDVPGIVFVADGYDSPVGTHEARHGDKIWPPGWADASPFGVLILMGTPQEAYSPSADLNWGRPFEDKGLPVYACASGIVICARRLGNWNGPVIVIRHDPLRSPTGPILYSRYGVIQNMKVEAGDRVKRGDQIAEIGDASGTMVSHLNFGISPTTLLETNPGDWPGKDYKRLVENYIDPRKFITENRPSE